MKIKNIVLAVASVLIISGCGSKKDAAADNPSGSGGGGSKAMASIWVGSSTFELDLTQATLAGSSFNATVRLVGDSSRCTCPMTLTGSETAGSCTIGSCTWNGLGSDHGCGSAGSFAAVCSAGTYTNSNGSLFLPNNGFSYQ